MRFTLRFARLLAAAASAAIGLPALTSAAATASQSSKDLVRAIARGDCDGAVRLASEGKQSDDPQTIFYIGRMFAEGVCIDADGAAATTYFSHAAAQGLPGADIEYGLQFGLGDGVEQSYERAGEHCQKGGLEHQGGGASLYSLGYVCTVRGLASRRLRETLPRGAIMPGSRAARVSFNPVSGSMRILTTPRVATVPDTTTGTFVQRPLIEADAVIARAWKDAMSAVPKPDPARLESAVTELNLDLDMTLEAGGGGGRVHLLPNSVLMPGDVPVQAAGPGLPHH